MSWRFPGLKSKANVSAFSTLRIREVSDLPYVYIFIRSCVRESMSNFFSSLMDILSPSTKPAD